METKFKISATTEIILIYKFLYKLIFYINLIIMIKYNIIYMYVLILNFPFLAIKSEYLTLKKIRMAGSLFEEQETSGLYNIKCKNITSNLIAIEVLV